MVTSPFWTTVVVELCRRRGHGRTSHELGRSLFPHRHLHLPFRHPPRPSSRFSVRPWKPHHHRLARRSSFPACRRLVLPSPCASRTISTPRWPPSSSSPPLAHLSAWSRRCSHPLPILNISEHYTRTRLQQKSEKYKSQFVRRGLQSTLGRSQSSSPLLLLLHPPSPSSFYPVAPAFHLASCPRSAHSSPAPSHWRPDRHSEGARGRDCQLVRARA